MDSNRISACTFPVRELDLDYAFGLMSRSGYEKIDLWGGPPNYSSDPAKCDPAALKRKADEYRLRIANLGTYAGRKFFEVGEQAEMREMRRSIDIAVFLGCRSIRVNAGEGEDPAIVDQMVDFFRQSASYAVEKDIFLGIENHGGSIAHDPDLVMRLVSAVDSTHFGILYDPANLMGCGADYIAAYSKFKGRITHVHVKDCRVKDGKHESTMLGDGEIDWKWITSRLEGDGYTGDYALEFEIWDRYPIESNLPKWLEYFRGL